MEHLGTEIEPGKVEFSTAAQEHAERNHEKDFPVLLPHVGAVTLNPLYVGDDIRNPGKIELVSRLPGQGGALLVAISIERTEGGVYNICSFYPISLKKVEARRQKGMLHVVKK